MKDLEDGYTRIANEVLEDCARSKILCVKSRVLLAIWRNTYGWKGHPKARLLSQTYLAQATGASIGSVKSALRDLKTEGMINRDGSMTGYHKYWTQGGQDSDHGQDPAQAEVCPEGGQDPSQKVVRIQTTKKEKKENRKKVISTQLPDDAKITDKMFTTAVAHGMTEPAEIDFQWEKFKAHHQARGNKFQKWDRAWLTWVLNWKKWGKEKDDGDSSVTERVIRKVFGTVEPQDERG